MNPVTKKNWPLFAVIAMLLAAAADDRPPAMDAAVDGYTAVRDDVLAELNAAHDKLPACEQALIGAQDDLMVVKADSVAARAAVDQLRASVGDHRQHIEYLESVIKDLRKDVSPTLWEDVDATLGVAGGYALGAGMCVGMAWVFNQPAFNR